jgi:hypothetical protein
MVKVKAEPDEDEELAAMNGAGIRQLSDMLLDGDQMEFDQVTFLSYMSELLLMKNAKRGKGRTDCLWTRAGVARV